MAQWTLQHATEIIDGPTYVIHANHLIDNFNGLSSDINDRLSMVSADPQTIAGAVTYLSTQTYSSGATFNGNTNIGSTGQLAIALTADPGTPIAGSIWVNTTQNAIKAYVNSAIVTLFTSASGVALPKGYQDTAVPVYASASTFTVASIACRNSANTADITKATSTTVDISTAGLNGVAQSANLTRTVAVTNGSATITGTSTTFVTDFQVGDVIAVTGSQTKRITAIGSNTSMTAESQFSTSVSGASYKRGGEAPNTHYYLYAISDGTTPGLTLSTRNVSNGTDALVDLPSVDYTQSRQLKFSVRNDGSDNIIPFLVAEGWPNRPLILYRVTVGDDEGASSSTNLVFSGTASTNTDLDASSFIPPISQLGWFKGLAATANSTSTTSVFGANGTDYVYVTAQNSASVNSLPFYMETSTAQVVFYRRGSGTRVSMWVLGYVITEVH